MSSARKSSIVSAFDRARDYDMHAHIQREAAASLARRIAALPLDPSLPALEIGCGTGFLTERLAALTSQLTASDIAPGMIARAQARLGTRAGLSFAVIDGEAPPEPPRCGWGLIASSLAFQWFEQPADVIARLVDSLAPGGWLAVATLGPATFAEWRGALAGAGIDAAVREYPDPASLHPDADVHVYRLVERHADGHAFLRALKGIGAATSWQGRVAPGPLRQAVRSFEAGGSAVTYEIAEILIRARNG